MKLTIEIKDDNEKLLKRIIKKVNLVSVSENQITKSKYAENIVNNWLDGRLRNEYIIRASVSPLINLKDAFIDIDINDVIEKASD